MNKPLIFAATAIFLAATPAHAELRLGGQVGFFETDAKKTCSRIRETLTLCDPADNAEISVSDSGFGLFAQYRRTLPSGLQTGTHFGYGRDSSDFGGLNLQTGATIDLLGLLAFPTDSYTPVVMFGYSSIKIEDIDRKPGGSNNPLEFAETALLGWKFAFGAEFAFTEEIILHALWQYADYSATAVLFSDTALTQTSLRFGISLRF
ncbi:MAG: porin family protein [Gammaproteobacteria bacterium]